MNTFTKIALAISGGFAIYKGYKLFKSFTAFEEINVSMQNMSVKPTLDKGVSISVNPLIKNPTKSTMTITQPFVKVFSGNREITTSTVTNKTHTIKPLSENLLDAVQLSLSWDEVGKLADSLKIPTAPKGSSLVKRVMFLFQNSKDLLKQVKLTAQVITYANGVYYKSELMNIDL